jgi:hypothetical protein
MYCTSRDSFQREFLFRKKEECVVQSRTKLMKREKARARRKDEITTEGK